MNSEPPTWTALSNFAVGEFAGVSITLEASAARVHDREGCYVYMSSLFMSFVNPCCSSMDLAASPSRLVVCWHCRSVPEVSDRFKRDWRRLSLEILEEDLTENYDFTPLEATLLARELWDDFKQWLRLKDYRVAIGEYADAEV